MTNFKQITHLSPATAVDGYLEFELGKAIKVGVDLDFAGIEQSIFVKLENETDFTEVVIKETGMFELGPTHFDGNLLSPVITHIRIPEGIHFSVEYISI